MLSGLKPLPPFHTPNCIRNPGSWSHNAAEEFTIQHGKKARRSAPLRRKRDAPQPPIHTTGTSATKGNIKRDKDGAPAPKDEKK
jgi:hypothetical protein